MAFVSPAWRLHGAPMPTWGKCSGSGLRRRAVQRRARVVRATAGGGDVRVLTEGDIVAVVRGSGAVRAELGIVTGTDSSGRNVDFAPLQAFVPELYVRGAGEETFARATQVRRVPATWVEEQRGWIVLDADVREAEDYIATAASLPTVEVRRAAPSEPKVVTPRQPFRPTRFQAFAGAALSVPVAALSYAVFAGERAAFAGQTNEGALLDVALVAAASVSVLSLIVGASLFLYGVNLPDEAES